ncbi:protein of unknown function (DUF928) [Cylindrospermum stagnale PCC 7417]|uniref:DUF928 domain-containing protein n=1 Tax=Cylindrospermum stagnale PCC 7417 TaxID=56107 RepID=K9WUB4_9NOST|nr:DUF928 domain-containing protein [Cylindrospermum stagnale]AFZ23097.1 protein of unknown function (DUF928) [Cylindrospermum stagnale PCC 7417]
MNLKKLAVRKTFFQPIIYMLPTALILGSAIQDSGLLKAQTTAPVSSRQSTPPARKPASSKINKSQPIFRWTKPPAGLSTIPGRPIGMGSRDFCPAVENPLRALVPFQERDLTSQLSKASMSTTPMDVWGLTTNKYPTFWFYVPYTTEIPGASAEFVLQDSEENEVYQSTVSLRAKPGIISVTLPSTALPLEINKNYRWFFKVSCSGQKSIPIHVEGDIQRVQLNVSLEKQLATAQQRDKVSIYTDNGIWFDALTLLAQLRQASPNNASLISDWQSLLGSVKLDKNSVNAPFIEDELSNL